LGGLPEQPAENDSGRSVREEEYMRLHCYFCGKSVSTEVPDETVIRAALVCPECIESGKIMLLEGVDGHQAGHPDHTRHANIQSVKNIPPQTVGRTPEWREGMGYLPPCTQCGGTGVIFLTQVLNAVEPCPICKGNRR
jgi:hypothetical protein